MRYVIIALLLLVVIQVELFALAYLERDNIKLWSAQVHINQSLIDAYDQSNSRN